MRIRLAIFLLLTAASIQKLAAQNSQAENEIYLSCNVQVADKSFVNYGQSYEYFYRIRLTPPVVYLSDNTSKNIRITETNISWENVNINRLTGYMSMGPYMSGECKRVSGQRKF